METLESTPAAPTPELHFLTDWEHDRARTQEAGVLSLLAHVLLVVGLILIPRSLMAPPERPAPQVTPLVVPNFELTQQAPNKGKINKEITSAELRPRPRIQIPSSPPSIFRPPAPRNVPPKAAPLPEPPRIDAGTRPAPPTALPAGPLTAQAPPPQIQPEEKPKLAFETPTAPPPSGGHGKIAVPDTSVNGAIRSLARNGSEGALTVGDVGDLNIGGLGAELNRPPSPGRPGSALQLLSDPMGVDFRPYLIQVLANVRRNWFAVYPESAKMGRRGKVEIQFAISKDGSVPKLVIVLPSGTEAFDRAAVAGISASNPFPPLPTEFAGSVIRLQFTFLYNVPRR
jgi:TonB family protein